MELKFLQFKSRKVFCAALLALGLGASAQSPGGVSSNLTLWLKADNPATVSGPVVQNWSTSGGSASGYKVSQTNASFGPALISGATNNSLYNFNPSIYFTTAGSTRLFNSSGSIDLLGNNGTAIVIATEEGSTGNAFTYYSGSTGRYQLKPKFRFQTGISGTGYTFDWLAPTEYAPNVATMFISYGCGSNAALRKNSVQYSTPDKVAGTYNPSISTGMYLGANNASEYCTTSIAEVILFNTKPTVAEMDRIETYLSIKYGITRGGNTNVTSTYNYVASDGTTVLWDKVLNTGYNRDIAAIGRDDDSGLSQKQSISVNNNKIVTISLGDNVIPVDNISNANTFTANKSFLAWGNNGLSTFFSLATSKPTGISMRLPRVWKTQSTNFDQQVTIGFEADKISGLAISNNLCLLFDDDGDFSNATVVSSCSSVNPTGTRVEFTGISIPADKPYFTLGKVRIPFEITTNGAPCLGTALNLMGETVGATTTYAWTGPNGFTSTEQNPTIPVATQAEAGTYTVDVTTYGCKTTLSTTVTVNPLPTVTVNSPVVCEGDSATITATPGAAANYSYAWTVPTGEADPGDVASFSPTVAGQYSVVITDLDTGCVSESAAGVFTINPTPTVTVNSPETCEGTPTTITATPGAIGTYSYVWTVPSGATDPGNVPSFDTDVEGTYSVIITNTATGCVSEMAEGVLTVNPFPTITVNSETVCEGDSATITATTTAPGSYSYAWTVPAGATNPGNVASFDATVAGTYSVIITEVNSLCVSNSVSGELTVNPAPQPMLNKGVICFDPVTGEIINGAELDTKLEGAEYEFTWYMEPGNTPIPGANQSTYTATQTGNYTVTVVDTTTGCTGTATTVVTESKPAQSATAASSNYFEDNQSVVVTVIGDGTYLYSMDGGEFQPSNIFYNVLPGVHTIVIHDTLGCTDLTISITTINYPHFFTPNGDTVNDYWNIYALKNIEPNSEIFIFNRYGKIISRITPSDSGWDGTYNGQQMPSDDYWFTVNFKENGVEKLFKAHFSLKR